MKRKNIGVINILNLQKGEAISLNLTKKEKENIRIGLGWTSLCDLDVHAILRDSTGKEIGAVSYSNLTAHGVTLSGDNTTGAGIGDDETIYLENVSDKVAYIGIYVHVYTARKSFSNVKGAYVRIFEHGEFDREYARCDLSDGFSNMKTVHFANIDLTGSSMKFEVVGNGYKETVHLAKKELEKYTVDETSREVNREDAQVIKKNVRHTIGGFFKKSAKALENVMEELF